MEGIGVDYIIDLLEKAEHQVLNNCASEQDKQKVYCNINEALGCLRIQSSFLSLFSPLCFNSPEELLYKAKEIKLELYKEASIINYLIHVAGNISRSSHTRLFYLKTPYSKDTYESLADHNFKTAFGKENIYLGSNGFHGSLLIVEVEHEGKN